MIFKTPKRSPIVSVKSNRGWGVSRGHHGRSASTNKEVSLELDKSWWRSGGDPLLRRRGKEDNRAEATACYHNGGARAPPTPSLSLSQTDTHTHTLCQSIRLFNRAALFVTFECCQKSCKNKQKKMSDIGPIFHSSNGI